MTVRVPPTITSPRELKLDGKDSGRVRRHRADMVQGAGSRLVRTRTIALQAVIDKLADAVAAVALEASPAIAARLAWQIPPRLSGAG